MSERDMASLIAKLEKQLGIAWSDIVEWLRQQNGLAEIEARLATGDIDSIVSDVESAASKFAADTHDAYLTAGKTEAAWLDEQVPNVLVRFDVANEHAVAAARQNELEVIRGLTDEQRQTVQQAIIAGHQSGANPREVARDIRDSIGLAPNQEAAVRSYRRALEAGDYSNALDRELGSGHSDRTIRSAQRGVAPMDPDQIDTAVERYRQNFIAHRAEVIARTESLRCAHQGSDEALRQAVERGDVDADQLEGQWLPGPKTKNARPDHRDPALLAQRPKFGQSFDMPDGTRMRHPGDPAGGVKNCACCECTKATRLVA